MCERGVVVCVRFRARAVVNLHLREGDEGGIRCVSGGVRM